MGGTWIGWAQPHVWAERMRYALPIVESPGNSVAEQAIWFAEGKRWVRPATEYADAFGAGVRKFMEPASEVFPQPFDPFFSEAFRRYDPLSSAEALERAHKGSIFLFRQFHAKFYPQIPDTIEPLIEAGIAFVGTVDDVRRQMAAVQEQLNPEWFMVISDQGFMPLYEVKKQMELFGTKVMPEFIG
jgi:alkanesulfonate monooxygenase SsuD/methylene tetrahydromethanopterin reductase-like flavin-dependent oxidoreductase (luciferase family)